MPCASGVDFDDEGRLYVSNVLGRQITVMDPWTGRIIETYGAADGVEGPEDLAIGPDGSLYWTEIWTGEIVRRQPDGTVTRQFVAPFLNPIAFSPEGRLFAGQAFMGDGLYEIDPEMLTGPELVYTTGDPANHFNKMAFGPDGWLYSSRGGGMVRLNVGTLEVEVLTDEFSGASAFDSRGRLHVMTDDQILRFNPDTGEVVVVAEVKDGNDNLAFDARDRLFFSNFVDGSVHQLMRAGGIRTVSRGGLMVPGGIAVMPNASGGDSIYVADFFALREFSGRSGWPGIEGRDFFYDAVATASPDGGNLILSSWFGNVVEVWDPATQSVLEAHFFNVPLNAVKFQGDIVVAELGSGSVVRQDGAGVRDTLAAGLAVPAGLAYTEDDLWVADWATGIVWQIVADGVVLTTPVQVAAGLDLPEGLAVDHDGTLLAVESGAGRLSRIDPATGVVTTVKDGLALGAPPPTGWTPTWNFNGVAVGQDGAIYVTGDIGRVVYRIRELDFWKFWTPWSRTADASLSLDGGSGGEEE
jgi:sugar lactone lactonase YvrE